MNRVNSGFGCRPQPTTSAPSRAKRSAASRPILPPVPVIMQTFPDSRPEMASSRLKLAYVVILPLARPDLVKGGNRGLIGRLGSAFGGVFAQRPYPLRNACQGSQAAVRLPGQLDPPSGTSFPSDVDSTRLIHQPHCAGESGTHATTRENHRTSSASCQRNECRDYAPKSKSKHTDPNQTANTDGAKPAVDFKSR